MSTGFNWSTDKKKKEKSRQKDCKINKMCSKQKRKKLSRETREVETKRRETERDGEPARSLTLASTKLSSLLSGLNPFRKHPIMSKKVRKYQHNDLVKVRQIIKTKERKASLCVHVMELQWSCQTEEPNPNVSATFKMDQPVFH